MKEDLFRHIEGGKGESKQLVFLYMLSYSGIVLLWTLLGPGAVSCIERCPHFRNPFIVDTLGLGEVRGVLISGVKLFY